LPRIVLACLVAVIALGVGLRFTNLGGKPYWFDETVTSLRVSGLWEEDLYQELGRRPQLFKAGDFLRYQSPQPGTSWRDVVSGLAHEEPQHSPLYYVLSRFWAEAFGGTPAVLRALSAVLSVLALPCAFWLSLELFGSYAIAWLALALFAVSPFEVLQAQTAREYGFWVTATLLSSAALLRALRLRTRGAWLLYGFAMLLAMQTFVFSAFIVAGQAAYVFVVEHVWRAPGKPSQARAPSPGRAPWQSVLRRSALVPFLAAAGLAVLSVVPWLLGIESPAQVESATKWTETPRSPSAMLKAYAAGLVRVFFDINSQSTASRTELGIVAALSLLLAIQLSFGLLVIWRRRHADRGTFLLFLIGGNAVPLVLHDLLLHGQLSAVSRLLAPAYAAIHFVFARSLVQLGAERRRLPIAAVVAAALIGLGIFSDIESARAEVWWNKDPNNLNPRAARVIRAAERPLVITDGWAEDMFSLAYHLDPATPVLGMFLAYQGHPIEAQVDVPLPGDAREIFFFNARSYTPGAFGAWLEKQRAQGLAQPVLTEGDFTVLWKISALDSQRASPTRDVPP
jgi:uncharacterized membrane protein